MASERLPVSDGPDMPRQRMEEVCAAKRKLSEKVTSFCSPFSVVPLISCCGLLVFEGSRKWDDIDAVIP